MSEPRLRNDAPRNDGATLITYVNMMVCGHLLSLIPALIAFVFRPLNAPVILALVGLSLLCAYVGSGEIVQRGASRKAYFLYSGCVLACLVSWITAIFGMVGMPIGF